MSRTYQNVCLTLPGPLLKALDEEAQAQDRPRSYIARKLLERGLTAADRQAALQEIATAGLEQFEAENAKRERPRNPGEIIAAASADGQRMLDAHREIAKGGTR
jgi:predicted transcriptional regulator